MTMTAANPYAAFQAYHDHGWRAILPLPYRRKKHPPEGYTGRDGQDPSYADCWTWADGQDGARNICLRMPDDVIGIDVDDYAGKGGGDTLLRLVEKYGPLPATWLSTSRDDGMSGIRFYRVPPGTELPGILGPGIEAIQRHHRYAVVWPSEHPEGGTYCWVNEADPANTAGVPEVDRLPELPATWVEGLSRQAPSGTKADLDDDAAAALLSGLPGGEPCTHMRLGAGLALQGGDRHDAYNEAVLSVVGSGRRGCPGAGVVLARLFAAFTSEVTADGSRSKGEATAEWLRSLRGAAQLVAGEPQGSTCPDDAIDWLSDIGALGDTTDGEVGDDEPEVSESQKAYQDQVRRKAAELRILADARDALAAADAADAAPLAGVGLADFLAQPDEEVRYRVADLWPREGRVLLVAAAKAGKTTLVSRNLLADLAGGGDFLGRFRVQPVDGTIVYLNLEVGEQTLRAWMRKAGIPHPEKIVVVNLRGRSGALMLSSTAGRKRFSRFLSDHGAKLVIADPLAPILATHGLVEDSNADVARFFGWWSEALADAGVSDDMIAHHAGHAGQRSRGASRLLDEPDAIWTLTKATAHGSEDDDDMLVADDRRFLTCYGRDVDLPESGLDFDPATGRLSIVDGSGAQLRREAKEAGYESAVLSALAGHGGVNVTTRGIVKSGGKESQMVAALKRLVDDGRVVEQSLGRGRPTLYTLNESPSESVAQTNGRQSGDRATGGVAPIYRATPATPGDGADRATPLQVCRKHYIAHEGRCPKCRD